MDVALAVAIAERAVLYRARERWDAARLAAWRDEQLGALRRFAYARSPFYRAFHRGLEDAPLQRLPVLTKRSLMENFDALVTDPAVKLADVRAFVAERRPDERFRDRYWVSETSGASGFPGLFLADRDEWVGEMATAVRAFEWAGLRLSPFGRTRIAQVTSANPSHLTAQGGRALTSWWTPTLILDANAPIAATVAQLNEWRPQMLWAYGSVIQQLAAEQLAGRLSIAPTSVISASELLTAGTRRQAEAAWGAQLFDTYATTDCGGLAAECDRHLGMHLMEDLAIIEVVDAEHRPVPAGAFGDKLLVTVLGSRTQPLIRYELDDGVRMSANPCSCGRPFRLIDGVRGRIEETLTFAAEGGGTVAVHPNAFSNITEQLPVAGWQIVQSPASLQLLLAGVSGPIDEVQLAARVRRALEAAGAAPPPIEVRKVAAIPKAASGKAPLVRREAG
jgi:putative adenylate-forming enzyme